MSKGTYTLEVNSDEIPISKKKFLLHFGRGL